MEIKSMMPWNWFKKEQDEDRVSVVSKSSHEDPFSLMQLEMNRLFKDFQRSFQNSFFHGKFDFEKFLPTVDIQDRNSEYRIKIELPGVEKEDVKINNQDNLLFITGEKKQEQKDLKGHFYKIENSYGYFERVLNLPVNADPDKMNATFKNGVLQIDITKKELEQKRDIKKIEIH